MQTQIGYNIDIAANYLKNGELVAIPTETVYGLAANALNEEAVLKIYEAKNRPRFNPLIIHVPSVETFALYTEKIPKEFYILTEKFCPGPITFLLQKKNVVPDLVTAGSNRVAIRVPDHPLTLQLLKKIDFPLAAPSANLSGYVSPVTAEHVVEGLEGKIPYILDGGESKIGLESTIIGFENNEIIVHRLGGVSKEQIEQQVKSKVIIKLPHEQTETPGQLKSHYATKAPLYFGNVKLMINSFEGKKIAVITLNSKYNIDPGLLFSLSASGDLHEAAKNLFKVLRHLDELKPDVILADKFPDIGIGRAINDRLQRAQHINK